MWSAHRLTLKHPKCQPITYVSADGIETIMDYDFFYDEMGNRRAA